MSCPNPNDDTVEIRPFYYPWPNLGVKLSRQWDKIRSNTNAEAPLIRAAYVDLQPVSANEPGENDLAGWAIGERDFRNKFRIWYDKGNDRFSIQYNSGTEDVECWNDYLSIRQIDGRVTIHGYGGLDSTAGGFYTPFSRNLAVSATFTPPSAEWQWAHNLSAKPILWNTYNLEDKSIIPQSVDVSNPNIAYFYFSQPYAGRAIAVAEQARSDGIRITDGTNIYENIVNLSFNNSDFYLSHGGCPDNSVVVNLQPTAGGSGVTDHGALTGLGDDDHPQYSLVTGIRAFTGTVSGISPVAASDLATKGYVDANSGGSGGGFYGVFFKETDGNPPAFRNDTLQFNSESFYLTSDSGGKPIVNLRGITGSGGVTDHGALTGLGDDDHPQYLLRTETPPGFYGIFIRETDGNPPAYKKDTIIFDSAAFYLNSDSTGKPIVSLRQLPSGSTALAQSFGILGEWQFQHNLNTANLIWSTYDSRQSAIIPDTVDVSDPNIAYFYFIPPIAGKAVLIGGINTAGSVGTASGITSVTDGTNNYVNQVKLNFSNRDFYLSHGGQVGSSVVNLTARSVEYIPVFIETASAMNVTIDPYAPYDYRINKATIDCRTGTCTGGFYLLPRTVRSTGWAQTDPNYRIIGLDPVSVSSTTQVLTPSSTTNVKVGDCVVFSIFQNTAARWIRISVEAERT